MTSALLETPPPIAESELLRRLRAGDASVCGEFLRGYYPRVFRYVLNRLGGDEHEAEQTAGDVMSRAVAGIGGFRGEAALLTWLFAIARNEISKRVRRRQPVFSDLPAATLQEVDAMLADPGTAETAGPEHLAVVRQLMSRLDDAEFDALHRRYFLGQSAREIAGETGLTPKAVENRLRRARAEFHALFQQWRKTL